MNEIEWQPEQFRTWDAWHRAHQPFELQWWSEHASNVADPGFTAAWDDIKAFIEPHGAILDIGCGPRPPFAPCTVIEPLAMAYRSLPSNDPAWWNRVAVHTQPAEELISGLSFDTIVCWNCLDHTVGWKAILDNMLRYGRRWARFAIATDFFEPFLGHPGYPREEFDAEIARRFIIIKQRQPRPGYHDRALSLLLMRKNA